MTGTLCQITDEFILSELVKRFFINACQVDLQWRYGGICEHLLNLTTGQYDAHAQRRHMASWGLNIVKQKGWRLTSLSLWPLVSRYAKVFFLDYIVSRMTKIFSRKVYNKSSLLLFYSVVVFWCSDWYFDHKLNVKIAWLIENILPA